MRLLVFFLFLAACGSDEFESVTDAGTTDVATNAADVAAPGKNDSQIDQADAATLSDAGTDLEEGSDWLFFELNDGSIVEGELVASYEPSRWWQGGEGLIYAVFDPQKFAPYPNDDSLQFLPSTDVSAIIPAQDGQARVPYEKFLRDRDIMIRRPPFEENSFVITGNDSYHLEEDGYGDFAWDFELTDASGRRFSGAGTLNEDFYAWNQPVYSGVAGEVIDVVSVSMDNTPGEHPATDEAVNNWVGIALGGSYYVYYLHFQEDGIDPSIQVGTWVQVGDILGVVGNSGVTLEPHMHVVLLWYDVAEGRSYSVPIEFQTVDVSQTPIGPFLSRDWWTPNSGEWIRDTP